MSLAWNKIVMFTLAIIALLFLIMLVARFGGSGSEGVSQAGDGLRTIVGIPT